MDNVIRIDESLGIEIEGIQHLEKIEDGYLFSSEIGDEIITTKFLYLPIINNTFNFYNIDDQYTKEYTKKLFQGDPFYLLRDGYFRYSQSRRLGSGAEIRIIKDDETENNKYLFIIEGTGHNYYGVFEFDVPNEKMASMIANGFNDYFIPNKFFSEVYFQSNDLMIPVFENGKVFKNGFGTSLENSWPPKLDDYCTYRDYKGDFFIIDNYFERNDFDNIETFVNYNELNHGSIHQVKNDVLEAYYHLTEDDYNEAEGYILTKNNRYNFTLMVISSDIDESSKKIRELIYSIRSI